MNQLINALPRKEQNWILEHSQTVDLVFGNILHEADQPFQNVYFPLSGITSLLTTVEGHAPLEIGMIGNEGMLGATLAFDMNVSSIQGMVQGSGKALQIKASHLRRELHKSPALQRILSRYLYMLIEQLTLTSVCTHFHEIRQRLARWILMAQDRADTAQLEFTHDFLSSMLGVRRSGVTIAAGFLQRKKLIHYNRGKITVLNRKGLEALSCPCYLKMKKGVQPPG